ncbi:hypothetical protein [Anaerovibrio sp.]|uniref:hypothetical protein n=1 Tax=Anaerovibrio sp. TaxID=1872532 RepID=UPI0025C1E404|nr:hypothetical protein [Anaerovibrio sp.]
MEELTRQQGKELLKKLHHSTNVDEIIEISKQLGNEFDHQKANKYLERNLRIMTLNKK